jgi:acyl-homoserine lactone acylase PvdQ
VDGSSSATEWQGVHDAADHLQVLNPPQGYMQNCNIPPDAMMVDSPFDLAETEPYLYGSLDYGAREGWTNQRGARALQLLAADDSVTAEEAMAFITDLTPFGVDRWVSALRMADEAADKSAVGEHYGDAVADLLAWDQRLARDSTGALKYDYWRQQLREQMDEAAYSELLLTVDDWYSVVRGEEAPPLAPSVEQRQALVDALSAAMDRLASDHGSLQAVYGDRYRVGRGESSWPVGGGGGRTGTTTLRNVGYAAEREDHTRWGRSGQTSTQVVVLTDPPKSWLYIPLGESDREDSAHYDDQAEQLFSERRLKPSRWLPEDLMGHIESRTVLSEAPGAEH